MDTSDTPKWGWGARSIALLLGIVFWLVVLELMVRVFVDESLLPRFVIDAGYGVRANQPNVVTRHYYPKDYDVTVTTNSAGMRGDREYSIDKPAGVHRVITLGDSMIFGFGAEDDEVVSVVLEDMLNAHDKNKRFEVLNFSVSGFGQAELLVTYLELARKYDPDTVILFYYNNDVGNNQVSNLFELVGEDSVRRTGKEYLPGVEMRELLYGFPPIRWLFEHSQAWNFARNRLSSIVQKSLLRREGLTTFSTVEPEALKLTTVLLKRFVAEIKVDGANSILAIIPEKRRLTSNIPISPDAISALGAQIVDGRDFLTKQDYFVYDTHIRPSGHRKFAEQLDPLLK